MIVLGLVSSLVAERLLKRGMQQKKWTDRQLVPLRRLMGSSAIAVLPYVLFAGAQLTMVLVRGSHANALMWAFFGPCFSIQRLRTMFYTETDTPIGSAPGFLSNAKPLQSEHWGV